MPTDTNINSLVINKLTKAQYDAIQSPSETELYLVEESVDTTPTSGSNNLISSGGVYTALGNKADKSSTVSTVAYDGTNHKLTKTINGTTTDVVTAAIIVSDGGGITSQDITGKEDKLAIDSTAKTASFTASVGNYYTVNIPASTTLTITLATPSDNTKVSSCVFFVTTNTGSQIGYATQNSTPYYTAAGATVEASKVYEINALWNGTAWCIAQVELEAPGV